MNDLSRRVNPTRRAVIGAAMFGLGRCACASMPEPLSDVYQGCGVRPATMALLLDRQRVSRQSLQVTDPVLQASGDDAFDRALGRQLVRLSRTFQVRPGFAYADDVTDRNAVASSYTRFPGTQGTVLFGIRFLRAVLSRGRGSDIAVLGVCAHEFGHISQFVDGTHEKLSALHPTSKLTELHADYLAGIFVGQVRRLRPTVVVDAFEDFFRSIGSLDFGDPQFHGTPDERLAAVRAGLGASDKSSSFAQTTLEGARYVVAKFR